MSNEIELSEEQLASVTGGKKIEIITIVEIANNSLSQSNIAIAPTIGFATSGKKGKTLFEQQGARIGQGNIAVQQASNG
jgi:bacteriocin-like protein